MTGMNFIVPARSWPDIAAKADSVRTTFGLGHTAFLPIIDLLELLPDVLPGFDFQILPDDEMQGMMGRTAPDGSSITLAETVYLRACNNSGRDRFTAAHELGHLILHKGTSFQRADTRLGLKPYILSEPQANLFAAILLMPKNFIQADYAPGDIMELFGVSYEAAVNRLETLSRRGI